jgi:hypothetical protein
MTGRYSQFQPLYADLGITAIPCSTDEKKPLVSHWTKMGLPASRQLAIRFIDANALGIVCGEHNRITTLDVDTTDHGVLKEAIYRHSHPRVIVQTASGKFHGYYRFNGERRLIRPWGNDLPIDVLGNGLILVPPSLFKTGEYHFLEGGFDDLVRLTPITGIEDITEHQRKAYSAEPQAKHGSRNNWLYRQCMKAAKHCDTLEQLIDVARTRNEECEPPMGDTEVMKVAGQAWGYTLANKNRFNHHGAWVPVEEAVQMMTDPDALALLIYLRSTEGPWATFMVPNSRAEQFAWDERRLRRARNRLIEMSYIRQVKAAYTGHAALYRWDD